MDEPVSLNDLMPTLLDLSLSGRGKPIGMAVRCSSFWTGRPARATGPLFAEVSFLAPPEERGTIVAEKEAFMSAVTMGDWKLIHDLDPRNGPSSTARPTPWK